MQKGMNEGKQSSIEKQEDRNESRKETGATERRNNKQKKGGIIKKSK